MLEERLRYEFDYEPQSGWLTRNGKLVGTLDKDGYLVVTFEGKQYRVSRIAWLLYYGSWPLGIVDHKNRVRTDNKIHNLRDITNAENSRNRSDSNVLGVTWHRLAGKWRVRFQGKDYGTYHLFCSAFKKRKEMEKCK
jgi:HNH endonuclease